MKLSTLLVLFFLFSGSLQAAGREGWALFLTSGQYGMSEQSSQTDYKEAATGAAIDYGIPWGKGMSLNLGVAEQAGNLSSPNLPEFKQYKHDLLWAGAQLYFGNFFLGLDLTAHSIALIRSASDFETPAGLKTGLNYSLGWQGKNWSFFYRPLKAKSVNFPGIEQFDLDGYLMALGYRF